MQSTPRLLMCALLTAACNSGMAQAASAPAAATLTEKREARQEARIEQGMASGQLTAKEGAHLDKQQDRIDAAQAKARADGDVSAKERKHLHKMQDRAGKDIRRQKHDKQTATPK